MNAPASLDTPEHRSRRRVRIVLALLAAGPAVGVLYWYAFLGVFVGCINFEDETLLASVFTAGLAAQVGLVVWARRQPGWSAAHALWTWTLTGAGALAAGFEANERAFPLERPRIPGWNWSLDTGEPNFALVSGLHLLLWLVPVLWIIRPGALGPPVPRVGGQTAPSVNKNGPTSSRTRDYD